MRLNLAKPVEEWASVSKGALIAGAAVAMTYLSQHVTASDFGIYGPLVVGALSVLVNILQKMVDQSPQPSPPPEPDPEPIPEPDPVDIDPTPYVPPAPLPPAPVVPTPPPQPPVVPVPIPWPIPWPVPQPRGKGPEKK